MKEQGIPYIENTNFLRSNKFQLAFTHIPLVEQFVNGISLPSFAILSGRYPTPSRDIRISTGKIDTGEIVLNLLLDEDMMVWEECVRWIHAEQIETNQYKSESNKYLDYKHDLSVIFNTNSSNPNLSITYRGCLITDVSGLKFDYIGGSEELTFDISLEYDTFEFKR